MIRRKDEVKERVASAVYGGTGELHFLDLLEKEEFDGKGRMYSRITIAPGASIGVHGHKGEKEIIYILSGKGIYEDNGISKEVHPGDVTICDDGSKHGIRALDEGPMEVIALILNS